jgi:hypothetical protein
MLQVIYSNKVVTETEMSLPVKDNELLLKQEAHHGSQVHE